MNSIDITATWHKESYDRFLNELLPQLLAERLPLVDYRTETTEAYSCSVTVSVENNVANNVGNTTTVTYNRLPYPDEQGMFIINDTPWTVVPYASSEDLDTAHIICVGEMLNTMLQERLGAAPPDLPWDETLLRSWIPLDSWIIERFIGPSSGHPFERHFQYVDRTNWLSKRSHIRRLFMDLSDPNRVITPGQFGRLCPYEKPEGPNMGRIGSIAVGATIREGKLVIEKDAPDAALGLSMSAIPLVEHTDANRLLMGANMMRQWLTYDQPEPALVQSGNEPSAPEYWAGRNMLTAYIPWGEDTAEDAIILSESGAARMSDPGEKKYGVAEASYWRYNHQIEPGDKLSNRYGMKGVVSKILPDNEMPKMSDGTPVDLVFSSVGIHSRLTMGQLREAVLGRLAHAEGEPIIAPPFHGPSEDEIRQRLNAAGLPSDGSEQLLHGETGQPLPNRSTAGWVYWGRTHHLAQHKIVVNGHNTISVTSEGADSGVSSSGVSSSGVSSSAHGQRQSELEFQLLHAIGATELIREHFQLRATIPGHENEALPNTPRFLSLQARLHAAGIQITQSENGLQFNLADPDPDGIALARPVPHPWLGEHMIESVTSLATGPDNLFPYGYPALIRERQLASVDEADNLPEYSAVIQANEKLARLQKSNAPNSLIDKAYAQLEAAIQSYFEILLTPEDIRFDARVSFSGRAVLAPGTGLSYNQMGLPDEMAWALFGPQVAEELGNEEAITKRTQEAANVLDKIMASSWILVNRVPTIRPTAMIAFQPVRHQDRVARIPSLACVAMDADFDGDQVAIYLPLTEGGQQEAEELLSLAGHLSRDPSILEDLAPNRDPMWGLALKSLSTEGQAEIEKLVGAVIDFAPGYLTRKALVNALLPQLKTKGAEHVLNVLDTLTRIGFDAIKETGFSLNPFVVLGLQLPEAPPIDRPDLWDIYMQQRSEQLLATEEYDGGWGHYVLSSKSGALAANRIRLLSMLLVARGVITDIDGTSVVIPQNFVQGISPEDHFKTVAGAQAGMRRIVEEWERNSEASPSSGRAHSVYAIARARRAAHPGVVFARAAAMNEVDPLVDEESKQFVGVS